MSCDCRVRSKFGNGIVRQDKDEYSVFLKKECPVCKMVAPALKDLAAARNLKVLVQDDPEYFVDFVETESDTNLAESYRANVEIVPTLLRISYGKELGRVEGWNTSEWRELTGVSDLGADLPENLPGCGSKSIELGVAEALEVKYGSPKFESRLIDLGDLGDSSETAFERGWTDGLPVVPPTRERVLRMLDGTRLAPNHILGEIPPNLAPCTVEKAAINAVMAGCKPEYMPVLFASIEAALDPLFTLHGLVCTTCFSSPIIVVNGPIAKSIGMNSGINALGQGNRANATIGRALNLIVRNIGGGVPGLIDRATLGSPSKYTFCFAENESDPSWEPLNVARGYAPGTNTVTLFQGEGVFGCTDQRSRTPEELTKSLAMSLSAVGHPKLAQWCNAILVLSPDHHRICRDAGWDRAMVQAGLENELKMDANDLLFGAQGVGEGIAHSWKDKQVDKFPEGGLLIVRAGGEAGLYSAILPGWTGGRFVDESQAVTREIAR